MLQLMTTILLWFLAVGCGVMAGVYFAFSAFVMASLGRIDQAAGIAAMNAINVDIVRSLFMPLFFGTSLASLALAVLAFLTWGNSSSAPALAGAAIYVIGMFVVTILFNVPLNDALAVTDPGSPDSALLWTRYVATWTQWNHVRTLASAAASALFIFALTRPELP
ncbi:anthrone oxygenase family protein [Hyphomicrobium sp.]|uniref:anthrone oxygenase family protein n=1 Tax=Hyphomicrobium sp. TaxID=82 RepID=UPI000FB2BAB7|nr:anthrone oxygenase family protein [Hyphomicrobium sp.]RUO98808.1 MAG: DUF1772 domain-containing protein [Hyphomicrobium sp.]